MCLRLSFRQINFWTVSGFKRLCFLVIKSVQVEKHLSQFALEAGTHKIAFTARDKYGNLPKCVCHHLDALHVLSLHFWLIMYFSDATIILYSSISALSYFLRSLAYWLDLFRLNLHHPPIKDWQLIWYYLGYCLCLSLKCHWLLKKS